jgi:hypothetical protein
MKKPHGERPEVGVRARQGGQHIGAAGRHRYAVDVCGEDTAHGRCRTARPHPSAHRGQHMEAARQARHGPFRLRGQTHPLDPPP